MPSEEIPLKKLHMASSIAELKKKAQSVNLFEKCDDIKRLLNLASLSHEKYEQYLGDRDEENAYIFMFRFIEIITGLQRKHKAQGTYISQFISSKKVNSGILGLCKLDESLRKRYKAQEKTESAKNNNNNNSSSKNNDEIQNIHEDEPLQIAETNKNYITCDMLKTMIESSKPYNCLIIDIRDSAKYNISKVKAKYTINIPHNIIEKGQSAKKLEEKLPEESKNFWNERGKFNYIVLIDDKTSDTNFDPSCSINILLRILTYWDYCMQYKNKPVYLNGGIIEWNNSFPSLTLNPRYIASNSYLNQLDKLDSNSISQIEYPNLDDLRREKPAEVLNDSAIKQQTSVTPQPSQALLKPTIDRSKKPVNENAARKPLQTIQDPLPDIISTSKEDIVNKNATAKDENADRLRIEVPPADTVRKPSRKENEKANEEIKMKSSSNFEAKKKDLELSYVSLKKDGNTGGTSGLKRSLSSPNIAKLTETTNGITNKTPPSFDRTNKPSYNTYQLDDYGIHDKHQDTELDGAIMGATPHGLTGLKNLGNTCYMNSILQCVSNTTELKNELCKFHPKEIRHINHKSKTDGVIAREVVKVVRILWWGSYKSISCSDLKNAVGKFRNSFRGSEQQDSHEFFTILMDWLHEDLNEPSTGTELSGALEDTGEKAWGEFRRKNNSIVLNLFYGQQRSTVTCNSCGKQSVTFEPFSNLSLLLPQKDQDRCTLAECLELYIKGEAISGWNCPDCKVPRSATKKVDITRLPPVLVVHFKRFTTNGWCRKKTTHVDFPLENLDMRRYSVEGSEQRNEIYNLYAVSNHYGTMEGGHYTAYCHNSELSRWYKYDDHEVIEISASSVRTSAAYILFYSAKRY